MRTFLRLLLTASVALTAFTITETPRLFQYKKPGGHALDAFEFWYNQRAYPDERIPNGAFLRAAQYAKTRMIKEKDLTGALTDTTQWTLIGPDNVGGRVLALAVHPTSTNILWAGAASGGLWKSTTAGAGVNAWTYVNTGYPTIAVSSIAIVDADPDLMYIGTGEVGSRYGRAQVGTPGARSTYGMGVLKSTDGGTSWALTGLIFTFPQIAAVQKVLINPQNPSTLFAATTEGVYRSANAGTTWNLVNGELMAMDIVINPSDTTILYASHGQWTSTTNPGIYKSTNGGITWMLLTAGLPGPTFGRTALTISPTNPQVVYAGISNATTFQMVGLYKTTNAGALWSLMSSTNYVNSQGWYDNVIAVHPVNPETVYCAGLDFYKSINGGSILTKKSFWYLGYDGVVPAGGPEGPPNYAHADHHAIAFDPANPNIMYLGTDGGIFVSTDGGETFDGRNGGFATTQFYAGFANAETNSSIALGGLQDNGTLKYEGTLSWNKTYGGDGGWCAIDPTNENILYEEYVYLDISKSTDGGASWFGAGNGLPSGNPTYTNFIAPFVLCPSDPVVLYAGAQTLFKTTDGGDNWFAPAGPTALNGTPIATIGVSLLNADTVIFGTGSGRAGFPPTFQMYRSVDGGVTLTPAVTSLPNRYPTDITFDPNQGNVAYLTFSGYGTSHVFKTTDAGWHWSDISSNLPDVPAQTIIMDPVIPEHLFVGTDLGVYRSLDGGTSWHVFDSGMPPAMILDLTIPLNDRTLRASTFGNGVYQRSLPFLNVFDYRALSISSPVSGEEYLAGATIAPLTGVVRNFGEQVQTDSFDVTYRILRGVQLQYTDTKRLSPLTYAENRTITFAGSFTPADTGSYILELIVEASDQNASNDTVRSSFSAVNAAPIASIDAGKLGCSYAEITGGTSLGSGDDLQQTLSLPFPVTFDDYVYDQLQVSTNGWAEFGTGTPGSQRGLSTPDQIGTLGANPNGTMFSTARPTKALGLWWEDLNVDGSSTWSYTTEGSAPDRVFIVQWKNVLAYYDIVMTTTRLNFQLRLHETSSVIEFHYGPVASGTFSGSDAGAMIGLKDHIGGNFHFYDAALGGTGRTTDGITDLSPLTDWPGPDSCYRFGTASNPVVASVSLNERWNLVSVPLTRSDNAVTSVFPSVVPGTTYEYSNGYNPRDSLKPGKGYWSRFPAAITVGVGGFPMSGIIIPVTQGWNLIGSVDHPALLPDDPIISSSVFEYNNGYTIASSIQPGRGYYVKTSSAGTITIGEPAAEGTATVADAAEGMSRLTFRDASGHEQSLFLTNAQTRNLDLRRFEMPPNPPAGIFDLRFTTQRIAETYINGSTEGQTYPIALQNARYPLTVTMDPRNASGIIFILEARIDGTVRASHLLSGDGPITLKEATGAAYAVSVRAQSSVPKEFALAQNHPNPFNPSTDIGFDLPTDGRVRLTVYDLNGREVGTFVDADYFAGRHSVRVDMTGQASGIYFYRVTAGRFSSVKKMVMLR